MSAFLGISVWITLAMVVPGLVTMAVLYGAIATTSDGSMPSLLVKIGEPNEWVVAGFAVTSMIMTQAIGILVENTLVRFHWLGPETRSLSIARGIDPLGERRAEIKPYEEYEGLYLLLSELRHDEDSHGHLQSALAPFFRSNNTTVAFAIGTIATACRFVTTPSVGWLPGLLYMFFLIACLLLTVYVARIRFDVMTRALWAARRRRLEDAAQEHKASSKHT